MFRCCKTNRGFSLIEATASFVLTAVLFLMIAPSFSKHFGNGSLDQSRHTLRAFIRMVEEKAVDDNTAYRIIWNKDTNRYDSYYFNGIQFLADAGEALPTGISLISTTFSNDQVDFDNLGSPSSGGSLSLRDTSGQTRTLVVVAASGIVQLP